MTTYTYDKVLEEIRTIEDLRLVASELDRLMVSLYNADAGAFKTLLTTNIQRSLSDAITQSASEQQLSLDNYEQLEQYFSGLKQTLMKLPVLQLTLAYRPTNEHIISLSEWIRRETNKSVVLQLHYNQNILGGAIITFEGRYLDLSLKTKLASVYESKRADVMAMIQ